MNNFNPETEIAKFENVSADRWADILKTYTHEQLCEIMPMLIVAYYLMKHDQK